MTYGAELSANLRQARIEKGLTQEALASRCRLPLSTLALIERGDGTLNLEELVKIVGVLGTTPNAMLEGIRWDQDQMRFVVRDAA